MNHQIIPSDHYLPAKDLSKQGCPYSDLKLASLSGGFLVRWRSRKTRRVFYRHKNLSLLLNGEINERKRS